MLWRSPSRRPVMALILSGGGARAAYQAGVLAAVARLLPPGAPSPFRIVCGSSAGALNAAVLAAHAQNFRHGVRCAMQAWSSLQASSVHYSDPRRVARSSGRWLWAALRGAPKGRPVSVLDNAPLRALIDRVVDFPAIRAAVAQRHLDALCVTATSYDTGRSISFFEGHPGLQPWSQVRRAGVAATIGPEHLLASAAIPFVYPPERIDGQYFGDGAIQQVSPLSPAMHLGADKVLIVGVGPAADPGIEVVPRAAFPSAGEIAGRLLDTLLVDTFQADLDWLRYVNKAFASLPSRIRERYRAELKSPDALVINPPRSVDALVARHVHRLPMAIRVLLRASGALRGDRTELLSYLLTEGVYCRSLMQRGFRDAMKRRTEIAEFFGVAISRRLAPSRPTATGGRSRWAELTFGLTSRGG